MFTPLSLACNGSNLHVCARRAHADDRTKRNLVCTPTRRSRASAARARSMALDNETLKWASLVIFTMQNAAFVLLMRASKVYGSHYNSAVAVLVTEVLKFPLTCLLLCYEKGSVT